MATRRGILEERKRRHDRPPPESMTKSLLDSEVVAFAVDAVTQLFGEQAWNWGMRFTTGSRPKSAVRR